MNSNQPQIRSYRDLMARNDDATESYYSQFTDEETERRTRDADQHA